MRYQEILAESMKSIDGLALFMNRKNTSCVAILYDPTAITDKKYYISKVKGTATMTCYDDTIYPDMVLCQNGYGPLMYAIMANEAYIRNAILVPSDLRSKAAIDLWNKFDKNPYVDIVDDYGIVGNGSLEYIAAEHTDQILAEKYKKMHAGLIATALYNMNKKFRFR